MTGGSGSAVGIAVAFNTIGWDITDFLLATLDALVGTTLGVTEHTLTARASISDTTVDAGGEVSLTATSEEELNATVSNAAESTASALFDASGMAIAGLVASNRVSSAAIAYIAIAYIEDTDDGDSLPTTVVAGTDVTISATDDAGIFSNAKLVSSSSTTSDGGASVLENAAESLIPVRYEVDGSSTASLDVDFGDLVRIVAVFPGSEGGGTAGDIYEYMNATPLTVNFASIIQDHSSNQTPTELMRGGLVKLVVDTGGGLIGEVYEYLGDDKEDAGGIDLTVENYRSFNWRRVGIDLLDVTFFPSGDWIKVNNPLIINLSSETYPRPDVWELVGYTPAGTINLGGDLTIESQDNAVIDSNSEIEISSVVTNNVNGFFALAIELIDRDYL